MCYNKPNMTNEDVLDKMGRDMREQGRSARTAACYLMHAGRYMDHHKRPATEMREKEVGEYLSFLTASKKRSPSTVNVCNAALRFLYGATLETPLDARKIPALEIERKLPELPERGELMRIFGAAPGPMFKAMFMTMYGSGLKLSEATDLRVSDVDVASMRVAVRGRDGSPGRRAPLAKEALAAINESRGRNKKRPDYDWLFVTKKGGKIGIRAAERALEAAAAKSGVEKVVTAKTLRHCFGVHFLQDGGCLYELKELMGHARMESLAWYLRLARQRNAEAIKAASPLDGMDGIPDSEGMLDG